ncbi:MAG: sugar ABC transporter ATP-binding protein [Candidatus Omnitrophica bacterium]|nr:sugar ABC transporter ATP-binding protein [Candidatus Omnitrophota bacterium]
MDASGQGKLLVVTGLEKSYSAKVLSEVDLSIGAGEVHALVGENGAGKSTLAGIVAGLVKPDGGHMNLNGRPYAPRNRRDAESSGIRLVMQELNLIGNLTLAESLFFDRLPHRLGWINYNRLNEQARPLLDQVGLGELDPTRLVSSLGVGQQQLIEIAVGLSRRCDLLILDEPTAALTDPEIDRLFAQIVRLKANGVGMIYISHRLEEVQRVADRISVLRDGQLVFTRRPSETSLEEIVRWMVGRELGSVVRQRPARSGGAVALRVRGLRAGPAVQDVSFEARYGEILGFAGLMGSGRTETMRALYGADRREAGQIFLRGSDVPAKIRTPSDAVRRGLALLTENRKEQGLLLPMAVRANISLSHLGSISRWGGWVQTAVEQAVALRWIQNLRIRCASAEQPAVELSGGNQQKVVIAKWLCRDCEVMIFDEPTRGIDVGAKFEVYRLLADLADKGKAIIIVSSDLKELMASCDRIAVMSAGRLAAVFDRGEWSQDAIMAAALSGYGVNL